MKVRRYKNGRISITAERGEDLRHVVNGLAGAPSLAEVLANIGWSYSINVEAGGKVLVTTDTGETMRVTAPECWAVLRERDLLPEGVL